MKANCMYHYDQLLTNFCKDEHCLMPLCPECFAQHTQHHEDERTRPQYATLYEILADVHTQITNCIEELERDKLRNGNLIINIQMVKDKVKEKVQTAKQLVYQAVEQSFFTLQKEINRQLEKYHQQKSIYSLTKSQRQDRLILEHLDQLKDIKSTLKSERGLSNIIYFLREKHSQVENFHFQFSSYLHMNQNYQPKIQINTEAIQNLDSIISKVVKVQTPIINIGRKSLQSLRENDQNRSPKKYSANKYTKAPFAQSKVGLYSPHILNNSHKRANHPPSNIDGQYQKLSKKVSILRQQNNKLSRILSGSLKYK